MLSEFGQLQLLRCATEPDGLGREHSCCCCGCELSMRALGKLNVELAQRCVDPAIFRSPLPASGHRAPARSPPGHGQRAAGRGVGAASGPAAELRGLPRRRCGVGVGAARGRGWRPRKCPENAPRPSPARPASENPALPEAHVRVSSGALHARAARRTAGPGKDRFLNAGHLRGCGARFGGERGSAGLRRAASGLAPPASGQGAGRSHHLEEPTNGRSAGSRARDEPRQP